MLPKWGLQNGRNYKWRNYLAKPSCADCLHLHYSKQHASTMVNGSWGLVECLDSVRAMVLVARTRWGKRRGPNTKIGRQDKRKSWDKRLKVKRVQSKDQGRAHLQSCILIVIQRPKIAWQCDGSYWQVAEIQSMLSTRADNTIYNGIIISKHKYSTWVSRPRTCHVIWSPKWCNETRCRRHDSGGFMWANFQTHKEYAW